MNAPTKVFLVLLQLAIGWHLLYEGGWKLRHWEWTSKPYLEASTGPFAPAIRWTAGDPSVTRDGTTFTVANPADTLEAYFTVTPIDPNLAPSDLRLQNHLPPLLEKEWNAYFESFKKHYEFDKGPVAEAEVGSLPPEYLGVLSVSPTLGPLAGAPWMPALVSWAPQAWLFERREPADPRVQRILAERRFRSAKTATAAWMLHGEKKIKRPYISGPAGEVTVTTPQRVQEYLLAVKKVNDLEQAHGPIFVAAPTADLKKARDEAKALHTELMTDLKGQTNQVKLSLRQVLTPEQRRMNVVPEKVDKPAEWTRIKAIDHSVAWSLTLVGALLILGLFSRLASLGGAVLLTAFYLAHPPWLGLPAAPGPSHHLIVDDRFIEIVALLALLVSRPNKRYGLDLWLQPFYPWLLNKLNPRRAEQPAAEPEYRTVSLQVPAPLGIGDARNDTASSNPSRSDEIHAP